MNEQKQQNQEVQYKNYKPLKCWQKLLKRRHNYTDLPDRRIITNVPDQLLGTNEIQTSKYNVLTFFPMNLIQQFTKPSNIYFLLIGILQIIPQITISQGKPTMFLPLTIVVAFSMIKDFLQDWKRRKNDKQENNSEVEVISEIGLLKRKWQEIRVGQIIKVNKEQYFPCDVLMLQHTQESKVAYVETKNLDGQNNLKLKKVPDCLSKVQIKNWLQFSNLRHVITYQKPNPFLNVFNGNIKVNNTKYMLDNNNIILRGCSLKINEYVIGMCLYNGHESKILLNSANPKPKCSYIEAYLNSYFRYIFLFQLCVTLISAMTYGIILAENYDVFTYFNEGKQFFIDTIFTWGSWFISFANFIPISLLVTVEFVRYGQGRILSTDPKLKTKDFNAEVQTSSVNDDLGQIQFVLSDKTGTLTKNQMDFKFLFINGVSYGDNQMLQFDVIGDHKQRIQQSYQQNQENLGNSYRYQQDDSPNVKNKLVQEIQSTGTMNKTNLLDKSLSNKKKANIYSHNSQYINKDSKQMMLVEKTLPNPHVDFSQSEKRKLLKDMKKSPKDKEVIRLALVHLALCHNVICQGEQYTSSSPDQVALASFARYIGFRFIRKNDKNQVEIQELIPGQKPKIIRYQLLHTLQFSSQRKRMSVIVKEIHQDKEKSSDEAKLKQRTLLLCKGADDIIIKKLSKLMMMQPKIHQIHDQLFSYACKGLRTLVLAYRELDQQIYNQWDQRYMQAWTITSNTRYEKVCQLQNQIQRQMKFVGITAIQDKLQDEVKQTINQLKKSSIKVWMLTGDKKETAISIGYSCGLVDPTNEIITLDCQPQHAKQLIKNVISLLPLIKPQKVTVLSGEFITQLDDQAKEWLAQILKQSVSVICCRVSPKGKEQITSIVKKWGRTLAIGDGANDVNMINAAHIGVGVRGIQGSQAIRAADYVISEFKLLKRLVLFYGVNFYHRNCGVMLFTLYKNIFVTFPILSYGLLSIQSAEFIYQMWIFQFYNIFFSAFPVVYFGLFDTIYTQKQLMRKPYLYSQSQKSQYFNKSILFKQIITTLISSVFLVITGYYMTNYTIIENGLIIYGSWTGMFIFNIVIITVNIRILNMSSQLNFTQVFLCLFDVAMYYIVFFLISILFYTDVKNTLTHQLQTWLYWVMMGLYAFAIQGFYHISSRLDYVGLKIKQLKQQKIFVRDQQMKEIRMSTINLDDIALEKRMSIGGYAFAEDQQRSLHFI